MYIIYIFLCFSALCACYCSDSARFHANAPIVRKVYSHFCWNMWVWEPEICSYYFYLYRLLLEGIIPLCCRVCHNISSLLPHTQGKNIQLNKTENGALWVCPILEVSIWQSWSHAHGSLGLLTGAGILISAGQSNIVRCQTTFVKRCQIQWSQERPWGGGGGVLCFVSCIRMRQWHWSDSKCRSKEY